MNDGVSQQSGNTAHIAVAGGGMIGLACAFELSRRGHNVTVFDPAGPRETTSWAAAGMIAPSFETMLHGGGPGTALARFCFDSARLWPEFARAVRDASRLPTGYDPSPTLALARTEEEAARLEGLHAELLDAGHEARMVRLDTLRERVGVSSNLVAALELPRDTQVDNRKMLQALRLNRGKGKFGVERRAVESFPELKAEGFDAVVWARGGREAGVVQKVKGQAIALQPIEGLPRQTLRFGSGYIVPKADRVVIGATSEEDYIHTGVTGTATARLLNAATAILPALARAPVMEAWTGLRPKRAGGAPLIGEIAPGEFVASAHFRNGILLAPATASCIADMVEGRPTQLDCSAFAPATTGFPA